MPVALLLYGIKTGDFIASESIPQGRQPGKKAAALSPPALNTAGSTFKPMVWVELY
jgi:hypothetical protein